MFWGCLSAGTASGSIVHQKHHHDFPYVYPPSRRVALARRAALAREPRAGETERARLHCPTRDPAATPGSRSSPRRLWHSTAPSASRRCSPRVSALPDILCAGWPCVGGGGAQGCASARGLRRGFGGLTGGLCAAGLMAGPAVAAGGRHETSVERLAPSLAGEWDRVGRTSRVACIVCVRRSCGTSLYLCKHLVSFGATGADLGADLGAGCTLGGRRHLCSGPRPLKRCVNEIADMRWE